jgi:hypothetical protein
MSKEKIVIEGYLTEAKLIATLKRICEINDYEFIGEQVRLDSNRRMPYDCGFIVPNCYVNDFEDEVTDIKFLVEFDGYYHYNDSKQQSRDIKKSNVAKQEGYELVRIPYFVQLNDDTLDHYFDYCINTDKFEIVCDFPHGFIDKKCRVPADFNMIGIERFNDELGCLDINVRNDIINSLVDWAKRIDKPYKYVDNSLYSRIEECKIEKESKIDYLDDELRPIDKMSEKEVDELKEIYETDDIDLIHFIMEQEDIFIENMKSKDPLSTLSMITCQTNEFTFLPLCGIVSKGIIGPGTRIKDNFGSKGVITGFSDDSVKVFVTSKISE